jgi:16S rRNA (cytidine1402-2'-O)-methyltransferase
MAPNTLGSDDYCAVIPTEVASIMIQAKYFAVENIKSARRLLRKLDKNYPIDEAVFYILSKKIKSTSLEDMLSPLLDGQNLLVISEAGCPGIADPGAELAALAHTKKIPVKPLVGPSSILLALIASGFNGQSFRFTGYLPKEQQERKSKLKELEQIVFRTNETQIFMDTPFRNTHVIEDLIGTLRSDTKICIAYNLTHPKSFVKTLTVKELPLIREKIGKDPAIFIIGM